MDIKEVGNIIITTYDESFTSPSDALSLASWKTKIQASLSVWLPTGINDYTPSTPAPSEVTMESGRKVITKPGIPAATFELQSNFCDYMEMLQAYRGGTFRVMFVDRNFNIYGTRTSAGVVKGYGCTINAVTMGMPLKSADVGKNFTLWVNFLNYEEFVSAIRLSPSFMANIDLVDAMPVGLSLLQVSTSPLGVFTAQINTRCGDGYKGLAASDFEVLDSNTLISPIVATVTDNYATAGNGNYTITLEKGSSPVALAAGDFMTIRVKKIVAGVVTYISSRLTINAT